MATPPRGRLPGVPLNAEGAKVASSWDFAKDACRRRDKCKVFGAARHHADACIRLHVSWQDDATLKFKIDNGNQVRLFRFSSRSRRRSQTLQGFSVAEWETVQQGTGHCDERPRRSPSDASIGWIAEGADVSDEDRVTCAAMACPTVRTPLTASSSIARWSRMAIRG